MTLAASSDDSQVESQRLVALDRFRVDETGDEPVFQRLVRMAAQVFRTPVAAISIVGENRVWYKAAVGKPATPRARAGSFEDRVVRQPGALTIQSSGGADGGGFLVGAPLLTPDNHAVGAFCIADTRPRTLTADQRALLRDLADMAMREISLAAARSHDTADRDPLTGLLNHRAFQKRFQDEIARSRATGMPLTVLLLDLKDFRFLNETYGHVAGDDVLRQLGSILCDVADECGMAHAARFGGDEFALLLPKSLLADVPFFTARLGKWLDEWDYCPPGHDAAIPIRVSSGAASYPEDGPGRRDLLAAADARLRQAKSGAAEDGYAEHLRVLLTRSVGGFSMLDALVTAVDSKDRYTRHHSEDVLRYCLQIASALGIDRKDQETLAVAALLHDVGKIGVPDHVLRKPGKLTEAEFAALQHHPLMGSVIVAAVPGFEETLDAIRHHHERWDGGGYPFGLCSGEIPRMARIMAVADSYSAMTSDRPYRRGMAAPKAMAILDAGAGTQWDPECVAALRESGVHEPL